MATTISIKLMVDKKTNRVVFAETKHDFVDLLLSFFTLPMGKITRLFGKISSSTAIGCMKNLHSSVETLPEDHFQTGACRDMLFRHRRSSEVHCGHLKLNIDDSDRCYYRNRYDFYAFLSVYPNFSSFTDRIITNCASISTFADGSGVFVKGGLEAVYVVTNDLQVAYASMNNCISILRKLGVRDLSNLDERTVTVGLQEALQLLNCSLSSSSPMTDVFLRKGDREPSETIKTETLGTSKLQHKREGSAKSKTVAVKLMLRKSNKRVLMGCIDNLYMSIESLSKDGYIKSEEDKSLLIQPKLAPYLGYENQLLAIEEELPPVYTFDSSSRYTQLADISLTNTFKVKLLNPKKYPRMVEESGGVFLKGSAKFMIMDDLVVKPLSHTSGLLLFSKLNLSLSDVEQCIASVKEEEALDLLMASLKSQTPLNILLLNFQNMKVESG
ncbi:hypothetical protein GIB67_007618 [Kingdonia uniflora]|uniref:DUF674 family protein n=1 Tax=Kingdonia uniflora TaxID=39325 RepID=A0A7J7N1I5_9MAGN|nr:hypothetical protein GIB67_007618 [Kingdonia uniflora]